MRTYRLLPPSPDRRTDETRLTASRKFHVRQQYSFVQRDLVPLAEGVDLERDGTVGLDDVPVLRPETHLGEGELRVLEAAVTPPLAEVVVREPVVGRRTAAAREGWCRNLGIGGPEYFASFSRQIPSSNPGGIICGEPSEPIAVRAIQMRGGDGGLITTTGGVDTCSWYLR